LGKSTRGWTGARTPSAIKRVRQAERRRAINQPRRSAAKTYVANAIKVAEGTQDGNTAEALAAAMSALDRAAKVGVIHPNAAARRKSRLALRLNALEAGDEVQPTGRVTRSSGTAAAVKAARTRIATTKASKAKGPQTAAGKARAALSKTARTEATAAPAVQPEKPAAKAAPAKAAARPAARAEKPAAKAEKPAKAERPAAKAASAKEKAPAKTAPAKAAPTRAAAKPAAKAEKPAAKAAPAKEKAPAKAEKAPKK
jgi:ribosomal protein S20